MRSIARMRSWDAAPLLSGPDNHLILVYSSLDSSAVAAEAGRRANSVPLPHCILMFSFFFPAAHPSRRLPWIYIIFIMTDFRVVHHPFFTDSLCPSSSHGKLLRACHGPFFSIALATHASNTSTGGASARGTYLTASHPPTAHPHGAKSAF